MLWTKPTASQPASLMAHVYVELLYIEEIDINTLFTQISIRYQLN